MQKVTLTTAQVRKMKSLGFSLTNLVATTSYKYECEMLTGEILALNTDLRTKEGRNYKKQVDEFLSFCI